MDNLQLLRAKIDQIDQRISQLLDERFKITEEIRKFKQENKLASYDAEREEQILKKFDQNHKKEIFKKILEESKKK